MAGPLRIQFSRREKLPEGAVYVGRPSKWGNPFVIGQPSGVFPDGLGAKGQSETLIPVVSREVSIELYRQLMTGTVTAEMYPHGHDWQRRFRRLSRSFLPMEVASGELRGKHLACWCALDQPCHADVLLDVANG